MKISARIMAPLLRETHKNKITRVKQRRALLAKPTNFATQTRLTTAGQYKDRENYRRGGGG